MSCSSPTTPHSSSSSSRARAYARMAVSTARQWRRRDSDCTHSVSRDQASSRESLTDMAVRLAEPPNPPRAASRMEKFVIDGGVPLRGTVVPAGNKNAALPILAASVLTTEEVVVRNVPRIRDVEAMLRVLRGLGVAVDWRDDNEVCLCAADVDPEATIDREHATRIRASFLLAGPLLARFGRAVMPPPGGDVIGRRRLDPHLDAFRALGARFSQRARHRPDRAPRRAARGRGLHGRAVGHGDRERADGRRADAGDDDHRQRRLRAARPGPRAHAREDGRRHQGHRLERADGHRDRPSSAAASTRVGPDHIEIGSFMALAGVTGGELRIKDTEPDDLRMIRLVFERLGLQTELDGDDVLVPGDQQLIVQRDVGEYKAKIQDGPWPAFPADLTSIAVALATQCEGSVLDPRVDVREPHDLHRQARRRWARTSCSATRTARSSPARAGCAASAVESPDIRAGMAMLHRRAVRRGPQRDRQHPPDRPRLRAHRRAPARAGRAASSASRPSRAHA